MLTTTKTAVFSVAALALVWSPSSVLAQSNIRERVAAAVQAVQQAARPTSASSAATSPAARAGYWSACMRMTTS